MIQDDRLPLKEKFLIYFRELPVQKLAGASIGRNEDTISIWKREDSDFSDRIEKAKAGWALENSKKVRSKEWLLERLMKETFGGNPLVEINNNYQNLTDDQLNQLIESKFRKVVPPTATTGEGTPDAGQPA